MVIPLVWYSLHLLAKTQLKPKFLSVGHITDTFIVQDAFHNVITGNGVR